MKCKPGDLAFVLRPRSGRFCSWTGFLVEVIEPLKDIQHYPDVACLVKHEYKAAPEEWLCKMPEGQKEPLLDSEGQLIYTSYGRMWDHRLLPIRPGESPEASIEAMRLLTNIPSEVTA